jgi:glutathione synthase/RimK-type ligase-like ATP-grasp enzyme
MCLPGDLQPGDAWFAFMTHPADLLWRWVDGCPKMVPVFRYRPPFCCAAQPRYSKPSSSKHNLGRPVWQVWSLGCRPILSFAGGSGSKQGTFSRLSPRGDPRRLDQKVLIVTTARWFPTARLAMGLAKAGFSVDVVCPSRHPLRKISALGKIYPYDSFSPAQSFADAISAAAPDLIIPGDEYAVRCVHRLYEQAHRRGNAGARVCALIERSLGPAESYRTLDSRTAVMQLAHEESIRTPRTRVIANVAELRSCCEEFQFPLVLKADGTSSGEGVRVVRTFDEARKAYRVLQLPPSAIRVAKRAVIDQDMRSVVPALLRQRNTVNAQEFIQGQDATSLAACWQGTVRGSLHFEVVNKQRKNGPASVMRRLDNREMDVAISRIVQRLKLSGLHGFDFLLEKSTGNPYLIEVNPRPTQVGHLTLGHGHDLPGALYAAVTGTQVDEAPSITEKETIALFPQEWIRNPQSVFLRSGYHDIPWEEPELVRAGAHSNRGLRSWYLGRKWASFLSAEKVPPVHE